MESLSHVSPIAQESHTENTTQLSSATSTSQQVDILFMVGTHHFPFTRLLKWADRFAETHPQLRLLVQHGETSCSEFIARKNLVWQASLTHAEMDTLHPLAVVLPAGPSLMMEWARRGVKPLVVPRDPKQGEHIDEHQQLFARDMQSIGLIDVFDTYELLSDALEKYVLQGIPRHIDTQLLEQLGAPSRSAEILATLVEPLVEQRR